MAPFLLVKLKTRLGSMCRVDTKLQGFHFGCNICVLFFLVGLKVRIWSMWTALIWQALDCRTAHQSGKEHKKRELAQLRGNKWGRRTAQQTLTYLHNTVKATFDIQGKSPWQTKTVVVSSEVKFLDQSDIVGCHRQVVAGWVCWRRPRLSRLSAVQLPWATSSYLGSSAGYLVFGQPILSWLSCQLCGCQPSEPLLEAGTVGNIFAYAQNGLLVWWRRTSREVCMRWLKISLQASKLC